MKKLLMALIPAGLLAASLAMAAEPVKIGMVTTLSTKAGYLGEEIRDGFKLAIAQENGTLGGVPVELIVEDDEAKPEKGKQLAGKGCHPNYFSVAYQNDNPDEVVGQYVTEAGHKTTYLLAPELPRPARTTSPGSSATTRVRSPPRSTPSSTSPTMPPRSPRSAPPSRRRSTSSCPAAWASTSSSSTARRG